MDEIITLTESGEVYSNDADNVTIKALGGNDRIQNGGDNVSVDLGAGNDTFNNYSKSKSGSKAGNNVTVYGGAGNDVLNNNMKGSDPDSAATMYGGADDDRIYNGGNNSELYGDDGNDIIQNSGNNVLIDGGAGKDKITNSGENTTILSGAGDDTVNNSNQDVTIDGGSGNDRITNSGSYVSIYGGTGNDQIINKNGYGKYFDEFSEVTINGGEGDDAIQNWGSRIYIDGGEGNDRITNSRGSDVTINGGDGNDTINDNGRNYNIEINGGDGDDYINTSSSQVTVNGGKGNDRIRVSSKEGSVEVYGGEGNDSITGYAMGGLIEAGEGDDYLYLYGQDNTLRAGTGNDSIDVQSRPDSGSFENNVIEYSAGNDTVHVVRSYSQKGGDIKIRLTDGTLGSTQVSSTGDIILNVGSNKITLKEARGERIHVENSDGSETVINEEGRTTVESSQNYTVPDLDATNGYFISNTISSAKVTASNANDGIDNKAANVTLNGGKGHDAISSQGDKVSINGGDGNDSITNGDQLGKRDAISSDNATIDGGDGDDTIENFGGSNVKIIGGKGNDYITNYNNSTYDDESNEEKIIASNVTIDAGEGSDDIENHGDNVTINAGVGDDYIYNYSGNKVSIDAGAGDDWIEVDQEYYDGTGEASEVTVNAGSGDDYTNLNNGIANVYVYSSGNDTIENFGKTNYLVINSSHKIISDTPSEVYNDSEYGENYAHNVVISVKGGGFITLENCRAENINIVKDLKDVPENKIIVDSSYGSIVTGTADADYVISRGSENLIELGAGDDLISLVGSGNNTIEGGAGNDSIIVYEGSNTIDAGEGDDYIQAAGYGNLIRYSGGNDFISLRSDAYDTIQIMDGTIDAVNVEGENILLTIGKNIVTLSGLASNYNGGSVELNDADGNPLEVTLPTIYSNSENETTIYSSGSDADNYINNTGSNVMIDAGYSNATINAQGVNITVTGGEGNVSIRNDTANLAYIGDNIYNGNVTIENFGANDYLVINERIYETENKGDSTFVLHFNSEEGTEIGTITLLNCAKTPNIVKTVEDVPKINTIFNEYTKEELVEGTDEADYINNYQANNVTIAAGKGNDTIRNSESSGVVYSYSNGDGDDTIIGFDATSTLQIADSYTTSKSGDDVVVKVGEGSVTLVDAAKLLVLNIGGDAGEDDDEGEWKYSSSKATYSVDGKTLVTVNGVKSKNGLSLDGDVVTISKEALGTSKVTISDGYTLALDSEVQKSETSEAWKIESSATSLNRTTTKGYTLAEDEKSIAYTSKDTTTTLAKLTGLKSGLTLDEKGNIDGITVDDDVIVLSENVLGSSNVKVTTGNYTLGLDNENLTKPTETTTWKLSTPSKGTVTATYANGTTAYYEISGKTITYKPAVQTGDPLVELKNLNSNLTVKADGEIDGVTVDNIEKTVTLTEDVLAKADVTLTKGDYTLAIDDVAEPDFGVPEFKIGSNKTSVTLEQSNEEGYSLDEDKKTLTYTAGKTETLVKISGLKSGFTTDQLSYDTEEKIITIDSKDALNEKTKAKIDGKSDYTLELGEDIGAKVAEPVWSLSGKLLNTATLKQTTAAGYVLASDKKSISYAQKEATAKLAEISGLKENRTEEDGAIEGIKISGDDIVLSEEVLGTTDVKLKNSTYKLALDEEVRAGEVTANIWAVSGTSANLKEGTLGYYAPTTDGKTVTYKPAKQKSSATEIIKLNGLKKNLTVNADGTIDGVTVDEEKKTVTLTEDVLNKTTVEIAKGDGYTLELDEVKEPETKTEWVLKNGKATLQTSNSEGYSVDEDGKIKYTAAKKPTTLLTINGLTKDATYDISTWVIPEAGGTVKIPAAALNKTKVTFSNAKGQNYSIALDDDVDDVKITDKKFTFDPKKGAATLTGDASAGYKFDGKAITYSAAVPSAKLATITGLNKNFTGDLEVPENDDTVITLPKDAVGTSTMKISGNYGYTLALDGDIAIDSADVKRWQISSTTATYKGGKDAFYTPSTDGKSITYTAAKLNTTLATIKNLRKGVTEDQIIADDENKTITLTGDALPADTKKVTTLTTNNNYTLKLAEGLDSVTKKNIWTANKTTAIYSEGTLAHYELKNNNVSYLATAAGTPIITLTNLNSKNLIPDANGKIDGIALDETAKTITLSEEVLNKKAVNLTGEGYTLALAEGVTESTLKPAGWDHKSTTDTLIQEQTIGYAVTDTGLSYANRAIKTTLATVKGTKKSLTNSNYDAENNIVKLANADLATKVTFSGTTAYDFASDYSKATITGSAKEDTLTVAGSNVSISAAAGDDKITVTGENVSVNAGKGNDTVDLGNGSATFFYANNDGNDVIANFTADKDKIIVTSGTVKAAASGEDVILTVGSGKITLQGAADQTFEIFNSKNVKLASYPAKTNALLYDDNYGTSPDLAEIVGGTDSGVALGEIDTTSNATDLTKHTIVYSGKK